jgi:hypothetical protein
MKKILIVSCTARPFNEIYKTDIYTSIKMNEIDADYEILADNKQGLPARYNEFIAEMYKDKYEFIVFAHDDLYIDEFGQSLKLKLFRAFDELKYGIIGIAGGINPRIQFPALWHIMCNREDQRGQAAHPVSNKGEIFTTSFGHTPSRVVIADGCFLAVHLPTVLAAKWKFNENYTFHHYDLSSCIDAHKKGIKIGVYPIHVIHSSPGLVEGVDHKPWKDSNDKFLAEYNVKA